MVPGNARVTVENEIVVGGHRFPKKVSHSLIDTSSCDADLVKLTFNINVNTVKN